ncbi:MAG: DUF5103 domain-containing protein [Ignavibacteriae bacterium]|nr:DUF5103 domain-containing protein [Ignavibacteriota bacterium]
MKYKFIRIFSLFIKFFLFIYFCHFISSAQDTIIIKESELNLPPVVRMIRAYGKDDEKLPPIINLDNKKNIANLPFGEDYVTIEFDVDASVPPSYYAKFVHCSFDWREDDNVFLNDITLLRTSNISWESSPLMSSYYTYRGKIQVPNDQVKFQFAGNWKMKLYDMYDNENVFAEARFFVVKPKVESEMSLYSDFYEPEFKVTPSSFIAEILTSSLEQIYDTRLNNAVIYRNNRWYEPYFITQSDYNLNQQLYKYKFQTMVSGFSSAGKIFRIAGIPAENAYRILNLGNVAMFPNTTAPVRLPLSDLRRNGMYFERDDDGIMTTRYITHNDDNYVNVEFLLDPEGWVSTYDVFVSGSFNNWKPDINWQMYYDEKDRYYHLKQWIRRGRHNYMYATGRYNIETGRVEKLAYDEYEGNTATSGATLICMIYYREFDYGGYDSLIGISAANIYGSIRKR